MMRATSIRMACSSSALEGPHKWDVDGNRYVDYLRRSRRAAAGPPPSRGDRRRCSEALDDGTQFGASHPREVQWAKAIQRLVPSAERIRFTSSGTEATLMAVRLARAFTGRADAAAVQGPLPWLA